MQLQPVLVCYWGEIAFQKKENGLNRQFPLLLLGRRFGKVSLEPNPANDNNQLERQFTPVPKEVTHWMVAERTAEALSQTPWSEKIRANPSCLLLGAVWPDVFFYLQGARHCRKFVALSTKLHGPAGEDTFAVVESITKAALEKKMGGLVSFLVGVVTHLAVDTVFHPPVVYHAGNNYSSSKPVRTKAVQFHRLLETALDLHLAGGLARVRSYSLSSMLARLELSSAQLASACGLDRMAGVDLGRMAAVVTTALGRYAKWRELTLNRTLGTLSHCLAPVAPSAVKELAALFYSPQMESKAKRLAGSLEYRHPASGNVFQTDMGHLLAMSVEKSLDICRKVEPALFGGGRTRLDRPGPSLETGLPRISARGMKHFAFRPLFDWTR